MSRCLHKFAGVEVSVHVAGGQPMSRYAQNLTMRYDGRAEQDSPPASNQSKPSFMQRLVVNAGTGAALGGGTLLGKCPCC